MSKVLENSEIEECEHYGIDEDNMCCLDCGKDLTEELASKAEYYSDMEMDR